SRPLEFFGLRAHARIFWGSVESSPYAVSIADERRHPVTGAIAMLSSSAIPGLEIGGTRFFHVTPDGRVSPWLKVFSGILKNSLGAAGGLLTESTDNQLASVFLR